MKWKKIIKIKVILISFFCSFTESISCQGLVFGDQESNEILQKYWYYRWRLKNDFLFVGDQPGESTPFSERNQYLEPNAGVGDATQLLGFYISTLATEHRLLEQTNRYEDMVTTRTELYYAYKAFERLDYLAEPNFPYVYSSGLNPSPHTNSDVMLKLVKQNHYSPQLNGFFMREDFPRDFFGDPFIVDNNYTDPITNTYIGTVGGPCSEGNVLYSGNEHFEHFNYNLTSQTPLLTLGARGFIDLIMKRYINDPWGGDCNSIYYSDWSTDPAAGSNGVPGTYVDMDDYIKNSPSSDQLGTLLQAFLFTKVSMPDASLPVKLKMIHSFLMIT